MHTCNIPATTQCLHTKQQEKNVTNLALLSFTEHALLSSSLLLRFFQHVKAHVLQELDRIHLTSCLLAKYVWTGRVTAGPKAAVH